MLWRMVGTLRVEYEGSLHHVMSPEIERRNIVADDRDRGRWLERTVKMYDWQLHAFVLMNNHHHLFAGTSRAILSVRDTALQRQLYKVF